MAKPTDTAAWATDANYAAGAEPEAGTPTKVDSTSGQKASGWRPGAEPPAQNLNAWQYAVHLWLLWLNGIVTGGTDLLVQTTSGGELKASNTVVPPLTFNDDLTFAADKTVEFQGKGKVNHADKHISFSPWGVHEGAGTASFDGGGDEITCTLDTSGGILLVPLDGLKPGDRIKKIIVGFTSPGGAPTVSVKHNHFTTPLGLSTTLGPDTETAFGITLREYTVDTPTAISRYNALPGTLADTLFARRATLKLEAASNNTVLHGVSILYDSIDEVDAA